MRFKKISAFAMSALMAGLTIGSAAAANYPAPFVSGSTADVAIVYGTGVGVDSSDLVQATNIQTDLEASMPSTGGDVTVSGDAWQVQTSSDDLELGESIYDVETYIDDDALGLLSDGVISNEKGEASYEQFLYFEDATSSNVEYQEDDDDNVGLFLKFTSGKVIARYVMDFTTDLKSDIESDNELSDIEDKEITLLGKTYTITTANNASGSAVNLILMSGAEKATVSNDAPITIGGKAVSVVVSSATEAQFTVDGETTEKLNKGDTTKLSDGTYLGVSDITYQNFQGGLMTADVNIGADKIEMNNGSSISVNGETIGETQVIISSSVAGGDISISEIAINMTAEDDLFVPVGGKLSEAANLDEPEVLFSQNWDIEFQGLASATEETVSLKSSSGDEKYTIKFNNYNGDALELPILFTNTSGVFAGDKAGDWLVFNASRNITDDDYFVLNTADPISSGNDARTYIVQYKSSDKLTDSDPKVTFNVVGIDSDKQVSLSNTTASASFDLKLGGSTFSFTNASHVVNSDNFDIKLTGTYNGYSTNGDVGILRMRTKNNALICLRHENVTAQPGLGYSDLTNRSINSGDLFYVNVSVDDTDRDGDDFKLTVPALIFEANITNDSDGDAATSAVGTNGSLIADPTNDDVTMYTTNYGAHIEVTDTSSAPAQIVSTIPDSIVTPQVFVTSADVVISSGGSALGDVVVKDSEVSSVSSKNLIVVGGSCINTVAANVLGGSYCGAAFTSATGVGTGQFLIESAASPYDSSKIALVVAGYEAADTVAGTSYLTTQTVNTASGTKYVGTEATSAELVVA